MSSTCRHIQDSPAREICAHLVKRFRVSFRDLDRGVEEVRLPEGRPEIRRVGGGDQYISPQEVYQKAIEVGERYPGFRRFLKGRLEIPWAEDVPRLRSWVLRQAGRIRWDIPKNRQKGFDTQVEFARRLFQAMFQDLKEGGLELIPDRSTKEPQRTLREVVRERKATCIDFVNLFLFAGRVVDLPVVPLRIYQSPSGAILNHTAVGLRHPETGRVEWIADISLNYFGKPIAGEVWSPVSRLEFLADYYGSKGGRTKEEFPAEMMIDFALQLSPGDFLLLLHKAYYLHRRGETDPAKERLLESIAINPKYPDAYWNLYVVAKELRDEKLAQWALGHFETLSPLR